MIKLSDIPLFIGDGSQDPAKWYKDFLLSTGPYGDDAVARLFINQLAPGSAAWEHINSLPDPVKASWFKLEPVFRKEWLFKRREEPDDPWDGFEQHILTEEMIFGDGPMINDKTYPYERLGAWVTDHLRLGRYTGGADDCLVRITKFLLPVFIQTILSSKPKPQTFLETCITIRDIPWDVLEREKLRHHELACREERLSLIEWQLKEISEKMDRLLKEKEVAPVAARGLSADSAHGTLSAKQYFIITILAGILIYQRIGFKQQVLLYVNAQFNALSDFAKRLFNSNSQTAFSHKR